MERRDTNTNINTDTKKVDSSSIETIVFGGGCFWCTEAVFKMLRGVIDVESGYAGGKTASPTYDSVSRGATGHAEVIRITYDTTEIRIDDLLTVFFASHNATTPNRQGADIGTEYRSIILYTTDEQAKKAEMFKLRIEGAVTEIAPLTAFYKAEKYHQDYYDNNKGAPYCELVIDPKLEKIQKEFADLLIRQKKEDSTPFDGAISKLKPEEYKVLREKGTEAPWSGALLGEKRSGMYRCKVCNTPLFASDAKFDSGTGWPSFDQALPGALRLIEDVSHGMHRTEVVCATCNSHLGHVFSDGPTKTGQRYCMNSVCLAFDPNDTPKEGGLN